ncbi:MAG: hypothetical protein EP343_03610 [Deltaproteobacteria bacterium]|nr:MAG: hypothetical protein EP343_03610 [Deltaproteobacteria bacterium]
MSRRREQQAWWKRPGGWGLVLLVVGLLAAAGYSGWFLLLQSPDPTGVTLYSQPQWIPGKQAMVRAKVFHSQTRAPIPNATVTLNVTSKEGKRLTQTTLQSDANGFVQWRPSLPPTAPRGRYRLEASVRSSLGRNQLSTSIRIQRSYRILVSTDKPLYQPGQTIQFRALALSATDGVPVTGKTLTFFVQDGKGNKVFKNEAKLSRFGLASAKFRLAQQVNLGSYKITAKLENTESSRNVQVKWYTLPRFKLQLSTDKGYYLPGETVQFKLRARYTFGKPVEEAKVHVRWDSGVVTGKGFAELQGETDEDGSFAKKVTLNRTFFGNRSFQKDALVRVLAKVTDATGQKQERTMTFRITRSLIRIGLFPGSGQVISGVPNRLYLVTMYPDGRPAPSKLDVTYQSKGKTKTWNLKTSTLGIARLDWTPGKGTHTFTTKATDAKGFSSTSTETLTQNDQRSFLFRTDKAVYRVGDTVKVEAFSQAKQRRLFLDVVKGGQTFVTHALDLKEGRAAHAFEIPPHLSGTLELHLYRVSDNGRMIRQVRIIQAVRNDAIKVKASLEKTTYRPGEKATVRFQVTTPKGQPVQAALSLAAVDEAVFAIYNLHPDLTRLYFQLQRELLKPRYQLRPGMISSTAPPVLVRPPLSPRQVLAPKKGLDAKAVRDAQLTLFSTAQVSQKPALAAGDSYATRTYKLSSEKREYKRRFFFYVPLGMVLLFLFFALQLARLTLFASITVRRFGIKETSSLSWYHTDTRRFIRTWILALGLPFLAFIAMVYFRLPRYSGWLVLGVLVFLVLLSAYLLRRAGKEVREHPLSEDVPHFRRWVGALPYLYVIGVVGFPWLMFQADRMVPYRYRFWFGMFAIATVVMACLVAGFLSVLSRRILLATGFDLHSQRFGIARPIGFARGFWMLSSRFVLAALPFFVVFGALFLEKGGLNPPMVNQTAIPKTAVLRQEFGGFDGAKKSNRSTALGPKSDAKTGSKLKAPTRIRKYFPETLLWLPQLLTDAKGKASVTIPLADSITTWRLSASAVTAQGKLGGSVSGIRVFQPFFVDIDFPTTLTQNDEVDVPVAVFNYLDKRQTVRLQVSRCRWCRVLRGKRRRLRLKPGEVTKTMIRIRALKPGRHTLTVKAYGSKMADAIQRSVRVKPDGKRMVQVFNGSLQTNRTHTITIPKKALRGSLDLYAKIYPGLLSQVVEGLDNIFRMPYGCFEQTSSTTYPNVLVLQYLRSQKMARAAIELKALRFIKMGYQRLVSFEVSGGGFSLYGRRPASTSLTAYGLMEFLDMNRVSYVDPSLIQRTQTWLEQRQQVDGSWYAKKGYFRSQKKGFDYPLYNTLRLTAYIAWSLAASKGSQAALNKAFAYLKKNAKAPEFRESLYVTALTANALLAAGREKEATPYLEALTFFRREGKNNTYFWNEKQREMFGIFYSSGESLTTVNTALVLQALIRAKRDLPSINKGLKWLIQKKNRFGTWNSTQATVQALRALIAGASMKTVGKKALNITVAANGKVAQKLTITKKNSDVFRLISLRKWVRAGRNVVALETSGKGNLAYQIVAVHYMKRPKEEPEPGVQPPLTMEQSYDQTQLQRTETLTCTVKVSYHRSGVAPLPLIDLGIPPGFDVVADDFAKLRQKGRIDRYQIAGRQVILYLRSLRKGKPFVMKYRLRARFPLRAQSPVSKAYLYYQPEIKASSTPTRLQVR